MKSQLRVSFVHHRPQRPHPRHTSHITHAAHTPPTTQTTPHTHTISLPHTTVLTSHNLHHHPNPHHHTTATCTHYHTCNAHTTPPHLQHTTTPPNAYLIISPAPWSQDAASSTNLKQKDSLLLFSQSLEAPCVCVCLSLWSVLSLKSATRTLKMRCYSTDHVAQVCHVSATSISSSYLFQFSKITNSWLTIIIGWQGSGTGICS